MEEEVIEREEEEVIEEYDSTQGKYDSDFASNLSSPQLCEDEDMKSDVVVSSTLKTRNGRRIKAVVRLNLLDLLKETNI